MPEKLTIAEAKTLFGLPDQVESLNDGGHRLIGSGEAVEHFQAKFSWLLDVERFAREVASLLGAARQTGDLNTHWHELERQGRDLFNAEQ